LSQSSAVELAEAGQEEGRRLDGGGETVVEEHDAAFVVKDPHHQLMGDGLGIAFRVPLVGGDIPQHLLISVLFQDLCGVAGHLPVGGAKDPGPLSDEVADEKLVGDDLPGLLGWGQAGEQLVTVGVVADEVAFEVGAGEDGAGAAFGIHGEPHAVDKERGLDAVAMEDVEDLRGVVRMRAVVEGEGDLVRVSESSYERGALGTRRGDLSWAVFGTWRETGRCVLARAEVDRREVDFT